VTPGEQDRTATAPGLDGDIEGYSASPQQLRFHSRAVGPDARAAATNRLVLRAGADLDVARLHRAAARVFWRHEALRTRIVAVPGAGVPLQVVDADAVRARLTVESVSDGALVWVETPVECADAVSLVVLGRELSAAYAGSELDDPVQYGQFCSWQEQMTANRPSPGKTRGDHIPLPRPGRSIPLDLVALHPWIGVTAPALLTAAWAAFLGRRFASETVELGVVRHARPFAELAHTVGPLARTVGACVDIGFDRALGDVLADLDSAERSADLSAESGDWPPGYEYGDDPLPWHFEHIADDAIGAPFSVEELCCDAEPFQLKLVLLGSGAHRRAWLRGGVDVLYMDDLAAGFMQVLRDVTDPCVRLGQLNPVGAGEAVRLASGAATDARTPELATTVPAAFAEVVADQPDSLAVGPTLTYAELDRAARRVAAGLAARGVGRGCVVAVDASRDDTFVVAAFGVLLAGAAFSAVDLGQPAELTRHMLAQLDATIVVTGSAERARNGAADCEVEIVGLGDLNAVAHAAPTALTAADDPAYIMFTSGTTGWPKGVVVTHRNLTHYVGAVAADLGFVSGWRHATVAAPNADLGFTSLFGALLTGGSFHPLDRETLLEPPLFQSAMQQLSIDCLKTTPSHLRTLLASGAGGAAFPRGMLLVGGEAFDLDLAARLRTLQPELMIANHYGPTETCIGASVHMLQERSDDVATEGHTVPIGQALGSARLVIVDAGLCVVPPGTPGEIVIGGPGVALGYVGAPAATAERFVPDPYADRPGARWYRTGDIGVRLPDGAMRWLGRLDDQLAIRGFRVEPEAVAAQLTGHPDVEQAAVVTRVTSGADSALVAFVVPTREYQNRHAARLRTQQVEAWTDVFDGVYSAPAQPATEGQVMDLTGWESSYTGKTMSVQEIRESVNGVVARLATLPHEHVIEIGCGTGLIQQRFSPDVADYLATDISAPVLERLAEAAAREPARRSAVRFERREAIDFSGLDDNSVDLVVLNSTVQYFPSADYLLEVLRGAARVVRPGGNVFVGDVRDRRLAELFHVTLALHHAGPETAARDVLMSAELALTDEAELLIDPAFFSSASERVPGVTGARIELKRGDIANELTRFRYDVVLEVGGEPTAPSPQGSVDQVWHNGLGSPKDVVNGFAATGEAALLLRDVPDARTAAPVAAWTRLIDQLDANAVALRGACHDDDAIMPEQWWSAAQSSVHVEVQPARSQRPGRYDVALAKAGQPAAAWCTTDMHPNLMALCSLPYQRRVERDLGGELSGYLAQRLPNHALPARICVLQAIALTSCGKIDRDLLTRYPLRANPDAQDYVAPRTPVEELLAEVWQEVLGVTRVGAQDDFFRLGGHSLLTVQAVYQIAIRSGVQMPLATFFANPVLAGQAEWVAGQLLAKFDSQPAPEPRLEPAEIKNVEPEPEVAPLTSAQRAVWYEDARTDRAVFQMALGAQLIGDFNQAALESAAHELARRHPVLRTTFAPRGPDGAPVQLVDTYKRADFAVIASEATNVEEVIAQLRAEANRPFDLTSEVPLRVRLWSAPSGQFLLFVFHHIAWDYQSIVVALNELADLYAAAASGRELQTVETFVDPGPAAHADWERDFLDSEPGWAGAEFWRDTLANLPDPIELAPASSRAPTRRYDGEVLLRPLPAALIEQLDAVTAQLLVTRNCILFAAFCALLGLLSNEPAVVVGVAGTQRYRPQLRAAVGNYSNALVVGVELPDETRFGELANQLGQRVLTAARYSSVPYADVVARRIGRRYEPSRGAHFDVLFSYNRSEAGGRAEFASGHGEADLGGLKLRALPVECTAIGEDISFALFDTVENILCRWHYREDLFTRSTIERFAEHYETVLTAVLADPDLPLGSLDALSRTERARLETWSSDGFPVRDRAGRLTPIGTVGVLPDGRAARRTETGALDPVGDEFPLPRVGGYRVESGHVRGVLESVRGVAAAAVTVSDLVEAQVSTELGAAAGPLRAAVEASARAQLPQYLVPTSIIVEGAGPAPAAAPPAMEITAALAGVETTLGRFWRELLAIPAIHPTDNFLDLGGHSILAIRVAAHVEDVYGIELAVDEVLLAPTLRNLAALVVQRIAADAAEIEDAADKGTVV